MIAQSSSPSEALFIPAFAEAAAAACVFELHVRMLADVTPALRGEAFAKLSNLVHAVCTHFVEAGLLNHEGGERLRRCVVLRNKLLHLELSKATGQLESLGEELRANDVWMANLEDGSVGRVAETPTREGHIFGWLLQGWTSGAFAQTRDVFAGATRVLVQLAEGAGRDDG